MDVKVNLWYFLLCNYLEKSIVLSTEVKFQGGMEFITSVNDI